MTNLPNANTSVVLGVLSILTCCCYGVPGLIMGIISLYLVSKDMAEYRLNPTQYFNFSVLNFGRILSIIGVVMNVVYLLLTIWVLTSFDEAELKDFMENLETKVEQQSDY
jgi:hypothetical protein